MMSPLQKYMLQRGGGGQAPGAGMAPGLGTGAQPAAPMGPGIADPYTEGEQAPELTNDQDGMNEFDPRRRTRPYMDMGGSTGPGFAGGAPRSGGY